MIKCIFLDLDDTLLDFQGGERRSIIRAFRDMGLPTDEAIIRRYIEINLDCWHALERGEMTKDQVLVDRFQILFSEMGISASAERAQEIYEAYLCTEHDFLPEAQKLLDGLSEREYRLFMATNGIPTVQKPRIADSGVAKYFEQIFISEEIGYAKPQIEFFYACFDRIESFDVSEAMIVGDSLSSDIKGGINSGMLTCHYNPKDKPYDHIKPDYKIKTLSELLTLLDGMK